MAEFRDVKTRVLTENTAQTVLKHLNDLESNRANVQTRWIWELLQNARDASSNSSADAVLVASIEQTDSEIIFQHNGASFTMDEIAHLIYHGSTKLDSAEMIGQYGSGFLTTHLLSPKIDVSGQLNDGKHFRFQLRREVGSVSELSKSMDRAGDDFTNSLSVASASINKVPTTFRYPLKDDSLEVVRAGISMLKLCAPLVVAFNKKFSKINIRTPEQTTVFEVISRRELEQEGLEQVTVAENQNQSKSERTYLVAHGEKATVTVPVQLMDNNSICLPIKNTPRLFLGFPLVGTQNFSFPGVINSFKFTPTEYRDGVYLGQSINEANLENQEVIEEACELLVRLLRFAASSNWHRAYLLAEIPNIREQYWLNAEHLKKYIVEQLIEKIRQSSVVLNESDEEVPRGNLKLPIAETVEGVEALWDLLNSVHDARENLPRRNEAAGWCDAVKSWAEIHQCKATCFSEVTDGEKLALWVEKATRKANKECGRVEALQDLLLADTCVFDWLNRLCVFLRDNRFDNVIRNRSIVLNQAGYLDKLSNLHRDIDIDEELKGIAQLLGWGIRQELRDTRLTALSQEPGKGDWDDDYVVGELIKKLAKRAEENPDDNFACASVRLFAWIVKQKSWALLRSFPVFAMTEGESPKRRVIWLKQGTQEEVRHLAPVSAWPEDLTPFSGLFSASLVLSNDFFKAVCQLDAWKVLGEQHLVRTNVLLTDTVPFERFFPDHPLAEGEGITHRTSCNVTVTDIAGRAEIMDRVRDSRVRGLLFWRFLTEWLVKKDPESLQIKETSCECGEMHRFYPAAWLAPLREHNWIRLQNNGRDHATARSLTDLLRGSKWSPGSLDENDDTAKLLKAMGIARFDLVREFLLENDEKRSAVDEAFTNLLVATEGDVNYLQRALQFVEDLKKDEELPQFLEERRERRRRVHENQNLGQRVEDLVKDVLEGEGFTVKRTGIGSDFQIEHNDLTSLQLARANQTWLVEVKSTRDNRVRMTDTQAKTAVGQGNRFLLCVVPVKGETSELQLDSIRDNMRFVSDIGPRLDKLCKDLDELNNLRDGITSAEALGVQLEVESGSARVRVTDSVWQDEGFSLADLPNRL